MADADDEFEFDLWEELGGYVAHFLAGHERSMQVEIGASELGTPCHRKLAYKLAGAPVVNGEGSPEPDAPVREVIEAAEWRPAVGTAVHKQLASMLESLNAAELASPLHSENGKCRAPWCTYKGWDTLEPHNVHTPRYAVELEVPCGTINGRTVNGHIDFYDRMRFTIGDWKVPGPKALKDKRKLCLDDEVGHPGEEYRVQGQVYARGVSRGLGWRVDRVAVIFLPMNGELKDGFVWSEAVQPEVAADAFKRARVFTSKMVDGESTDALLPRLKTFNDYCHRCSWFAPGTEVASLAGCPGDPSMFVDNAAENAVDSILDLP